MTKSERDIREKHIRLAVARMRYQRVCRIPAITSRQLGAIPDDIEQMEAELRAGSAALAEWD